MSCASALFFLTFNIMAIAQPNPTEVDPSKIEQEDTAPDPESSEPEENRSLIMQEGLSESSQLVPVSEEEFDGARETEQARDETEPGIEEEAKETVPPGPEARPVEKVVNENRQTCRSLTPSLYIS